MIGDYFKLALGSITHRKLRSWLTMLGIFIGIMAVVALISLGEGLQATINEEFEKVGSNRITITPGGGGAENLLFGSGGLSSDELTDDDADVVKRVRGIEYVTALRSKSVTVEFNDKSEYLTLFCIDTSEESMKLLSEFPFFEVEDGKFLKRGDVHRTVIGFALTEDEIFGKEVEVNDKIMIENIEFTVIGTTKEAGNPVHDFKVTLTKEVCEEFLDITEVTGITATVKEGYNNTEVGEVIKEKLRRHRDVEEDEEDFTVSTPEDIMRIFLSIIGIVQFTLTGIAAISLLVGGIGIMNTMYTSVLEQTREIGIMKAVGAKNSDVLILFMIEAGMLGTIGGLIGTIMGLGLAKLVEFLAVNSGLDLLRVSIDPVLIMMALTFSFVMGCLSGILPARRAASMQPVEALKQ